MSLRIPKTLADFPMEAISNPIINKTISADGLEHVYINLQILGNLLICFEEVKNVSIKVIGESHLMPKRIEREGNVLHIAGKNLGAYLFRGQRKKILTKINLPKQIKVNIAFIAGVVALNGGSGDLTVKGFSGEVSGITHSNHVAISLRCGDVSLNELSGNSDIRIALGSSTLGWTELHGMERIDVRCAFGGVDLIVPPGVSSESDQGGFFKKKQIITPSGSSIQAFTGFGGLDVINTQTKT